MVYFVIVFALMSVVRAGDLFTSASTSFVSGVVGGTQIATPTDFAALTTVNDNSPATKCGVFACNDSTIYSTPVRHSTGWCFRSHGTSVNTVAGKCSYGALSFRTDASLKSVVEQFREQMELTSVSGSNSGLRIVSGRWAYCALTVVDDDTFDAACLMAVDDTKQPDSFGNRYWKYQFDGSQAAVYCAATCFRFKSSPTLPPYVVTTKYLAFHTIGTPTIVSDGPWDLCALAYVDDDFAHGHCTVELVREGVWRAWSYGSGGVNGCSLTCFRLTLTATTAPTPLPTPSPTPQPTTTSTTTTTFPLSDSKSTMSSLIKQTSSKTHHSTISKQTSSKTHHSTISKQTSSKTHYSTIIKPTSSKSSLIKQTFSKTHFSSIIITNGQNLSMKTSILQNESPTSDVLSTWIIVLIAAGACCFVTTIVGLVVWFAHRASIADTLTTTFNNPSFNEFASTQDVNSIRSGQYGSMSTISMQQPQPDHYLSFSQSTQTAPSHYTDINDLNKSFDQYSTSVDSQQTDAQPDAKS